MLSIAEMKIQYVIIHVLVRGFSLLRERWCGSSFGEKLYYDEEI